MAAEEGLGLIGGWGAGFGDALGGGFGDALGGGLADAPGGVFGGALVFGCFRFPKPSEGVPLL